MAVFELWISAAAAKELDALPRRSDRRAVVARIRALREDPRPPGCVKLSGRAPLYRVRQGRCRIVYTVEDQKLVVMVIRIGDRKEVYRTGRKKGRRTGGRTTRFEDES